MRLLLLSNSTNPGEAFLAHATEPLHAAFAGVHRVAFIPFASVRASWDEFTAKVAAVLGAFGVGVESPHTSSDTSLIEHAEAIVVGGGNTFQLLKALQEHDLVDRIADRVRAGALYVGWSAGSNVACPTIRTTNDMPIVEPASLRAMGLVPFQINPHYLDDRRDDHGGETREDRIVEFITVNPGVHVVGLREGTMLRIDDAGIALIGAKSARVFLQNHPPREVAPGESLAFLTAHPR